MADYTTPDFLKGHSTEDLYRIIKGILPKDMDLSQGGHGWNTTYPIALLAAQIWEYGLPQVIQLILPEGSTGEILDGHARGRGITRRAATRATGELLVAGAVRSTIPAGSQFSTAEVNGEPSVMYETLEAVTIPDTGSVTVAVQCTEPGQIGNTTPDTVIMVAGKLTGVTAVTNPEAITGGTEEETNESLIARILEYDRSQGENFVGSPADYKRWARSVDGVGEATVIPAQDDSGMVRIVVVDTNGDAATQQLCDEVYNYIMRPGAPGERLAPVNALLTVTPPATMAIAIRATVELKDDATAESVTLSFAQKLNAYLPTAMEEQEIKYTKVAAALSAADGVNDYSGLEIGTKSGSSVVYGTANIPIETTELPELSLDDITITAGTV